MFELLKVIIETIGKAISIPAIVEAKKKRRLADIGTELFLLFSSINGILVIGRQIVESLEGISRSPRSQGQQLGPGETRWLGLLVLQQQENIIRTVNSIWRLSLELNL